jgi:hypothetical protein
MLLVQIARFEVGEVFTEHFLRLGFVTGLVTTMEAGMGGELSPSLGWLEARFLLH